jgi:hypothetical protein
VTITAIRTKRDKSLGRPVDILRPEVASQNSIRPCRVHHSKGIHTERGSSNTIFAGQRIRLPRHVPASCIIVHERTYARPCRPQDRPCSHSVRPLASSIEEFAITHQDENHPPVRTRFIDAQKRGERDVHVHQQTTNNRSTTLPIRQSARKHMTLLTAASQAVIPASTIPF